METNNKILKTIFSNKRSERLVHGFTLIELMIVMLIIGILSAIAYPAYDQYVVRAKRSDGMAALNLASQAIERFRVNTYSYDTDDNDATGDITAFFLAQVPVGGGNAYYTLSVEDDVSSYTLTATPVGALAGRDGVLTIDNTGARTWIDGDGTLHTCWPEGGNSC